jgi:hypothetical protein
MKRLLARMFVLALICGSFSLTGCAVSPGNSRTYIKPHYYSPHWHSGWKSPDRHSWGNSWGNYRGPHRGWR